MALTDTFQNILEKTVGPFAHKLSENIAIQGVTQGFMATMPVTLGVALLSIISGIPIEPLQAFLTSSGLGAVITNALAVTMNMQALYIAIMVAYAHGNLRGGNGTASAVLAVASMLVLMPLQTQELAPGYSVSLIPQSYLGSNGIFIALILGIVLPPMLSFLLKHVSIDLPSSVPEFVNRSLSPTFASIIILTGMVLISWGLTFTPFGNIYDLVSQTVAMPIMAVGSSPWSYLAVSAFAQFIWFFGVHPSSIMSAYAMVSMAVSTQNIEAFMQGAALPALAFAVVSVVQNADSLALGICAFFCKSERYKPLGRLAIVPAFFNITEPLMFGMPIVLNPTFFIPFVLAKPIIGLIAIGGTALGLAGAFNPTVAMPFVMPQFLSTLLQGGIGLMAIDLVCIAVMVLLFMPFFRMADKEALAEEAAASSEE